MPLDYLAIICGLNIKLPLLFTAAYIRLRVTSNIHLSVVVSATLFPLKEEKIIKENSPGGLWNGFTIAKRA